jgi:GH24 family phage-related lysozyme (muramidase)
MLKRKPTRLSSKGARFVSRWEGLRTAPYNDQAGHATIGIGHLIHYGRVTAADLKSWRGFKASDAYTLLQKDAERYAAPLRAALARWRTPVNQPQFDALLSFTFNVGPGWFSNSGLQRALARAGRAGKVGDKAKAEVRAELLKWDVAGGHHLAGLTARRRAEAELFTSGRYSPVPKPPAYVVVQGCPVPRLLALALTTILKESGAHLQSCYRGADAEPLLHQLGKHSQAELYQAWLHGVPGYAPANAPGRSTHELRNDGKAYSQWKAGAAIPWWACGIDIDDAHVVSFINVAAKHGWKVSRTYPSSRAEYHHVNFRKPPLMKRLAARVK